MVRAFGRFARRFARGDSGVVLVEALLVTPIVLLCLAVSVEMSIAVHQWNQTAKAMQLGARLLAVSDPLVPNFETDMTDDYPSDQGGPPPDVAKSVSCGYGTTACDATELARLIQGSDGACNSNYGSSLPGMCDFMPTITGSNILVTYHRSGLGYVGRPDGPVVTITLEARDIQYNLIMLGALLKTFSGTLSIPALPVTVTSEDLSSCKTAC